MHMIGEDNPGVDAEGRARAPGEPRCAICRFASPTDPNGGRAGSLKDEGAARNPIPAIIRHTRSKPELLERRKALRFSALRLLRRRRFGVDHSVTVETCTIDLNSPAFDNAKFPTEPSDGVPRSHAPRDNFSVRIDIVFLEAVDRDHAHTDFLIQTICPQNGDSLILYKPYPSFLTTGRITGRRCRQWSSDRPEFSMRNKLCTVYDAYENFRPV